MPEMSLGRTVCRCRVRSGRITYIIFVSRFTFNYVGSCCVNRSYICVTDVAQKDRRDPSVGRRRVASAWPDPWRVPADPSSRVRESDANAVRLCGTSGHGPCRRPHAPLRVRPERALLWPCGRRLCTPARWCLVASRRPTCDDHLTDTVCPAVAHARPVSNTHDIMQPDLTHYIVGE